MNRDYDELNLNKFHYCSFPEVSESAGVLVAETKTMMQQKYYCAFLTLLTLRQN